MEERLGVAADQRERRAQLVAHGRDEALAQLLEGADRADVADDRGRLGATGMSPTVGTVPGDRGVAAGDTDRSAVGAPDRGFAIGHRLAGRHDLEQGAVVRPVAARDGAAEHVSAGQAERVADRDPEQALAGRIEPDDPSIAIDLEDDVGRAVDHGRQLATLALEGLAQPGAPERDDQLMPCQLDDPDAVGVRRPTIRAPQPEQDRGRLVGQADRAPRPRRCTNAVRPRAWPASSGSAARQVAGRRSRPAASTRGPPARRTTAPRRRQRRAGRPPR